MAERTYSHTHSEYDIAEAPPRGEQGCLSHAAIQRRNAYIKGIYDFHTMPYYLGATLRRAFPHPPPKDISVGPVPRLPDYIHDCLNGRSREEDLWCQTALDHIHRISLAAANLATLYVLD